MTDKKAKKRISVYISLAWMMLLVVFSGFAMAAPTYVSPAYGVDEIQFGAGGTNDWNSANYNARASLGDLAIGNSASSAYQAYAGFTTTDEPFIEMTVPAVSIEVGTGTPKVLALNTPAAASAGFEIRAWLADGYVVVNGSDPPKYGNRTFTNLTSPTAPNSSQEQFGINLVSNTNPSNVGSNPVQVPDATFSFGVAATGYNTANQYKYVKGDTIASSPKSSSITQYTITYMFNAVANTAAGQYVMNHDLVAVGTY
jgi:hypothetical protein